MGKRLIDDLYKDRICKLLACYLKLPKDKVIRPELTKDRKPQLEKWLHNRDCRPLR